MYKVLIVDDEKIVRIALKTLIHWEEYGFLIVGGAADGLSALSMVEKHCPEVLITDLKMPKMDGIALIKKLKENGYGGKIIVLSNYGEFELVREAMKLGIYDYILKLTLKSEDFVSMMQEIAGEISEEKNRNEKKLVEKIRLNESREALKSIFLKELLTEETFDLQKASQSAKLLGIECDYRNFYLLYILLEPFDGSNANTLISDRKLLSFSVANIIFEIIGNKPGMEVVEISPDRSAAIIPAGDASELNDKAFQSAVNISRSIKTYLNITVSIVVGKEFQGYTGMREMFKLCTEYADIRFYTGFGSVIKVELPLKRGTPEALADLSGKTGKTLQRLLEFSEVEQACAEVERYLGCAAEENFESSELKKQILQMTDGLEKALLESGRQEDAFRKGFEEEVLKSETITGVKNRFIHAMKCLGREIEEERKQRHRKEITLITEYLNKNYDRKISLNDIARQVNLNESYLCRMFKKETGQSLMNFLNNIRMERAGEFLKKPDASIKDVAAAVGVIDPFYFSKIFNKYHGISPTDYKKRMLGRGH